MSSEGQKTNKSETGLLLGYQTICYARQSGQIRQQNMSLSADTVDIVNQGRRQFQTKKPDSDSQWWCEQGHNESNILLPVPAAIKIMEKQLSYEQEVQEVTFWTPKEVAVASSSATDIDLFFSLSSNWRYTNNNWTALFKEWVAWGVTYKSQHCGI